MVAGSITLVAFIVVPQILARFGFTNDIVAFFLMPLVAFGLLIFIFSMYLAPLIINPARFIIILPIVIVGAGLITFGLYM